MGLNCVLDLMSSDRVCDNCLLVAAAGAEDFSPPMFSAWDARGRMALARGDSLSCGMNCRLVFTHSVSCAWR